MQLPHNWIGPLAVLAAVPVGFFLAGYRGFRTFSVAQSLLRISASLPLGISGLAHFFWAARFALLVPPPFADPRMWVHFTGVLELLGFAGMILPETARAASIGVSVLMIAVFPANIYAAGRAVAGIPMPQVPVRLLLQALYILIVLTGAWGLPRMRFSTVQVR
jgi:uncharacterized membrane protein